VRSHGIEAIKRARPVRARLECGSHSMLSKPDAPASVENVITFATKIKQQKYFIVLQRFCCCRQTSMDGVVKESERKERNEK
jgi:hypothetical protein